LLFIDTRLCSTLKLFEKEKKNHNEPEVVSVSPRGRLNQRTPFIKILTDMFIRCLTANINLKCLPTDLPLAETLYGCGGVRYGTVWILFSWISSVFKSDRVLAINDDAVFLGDVLH